jgi:hypothetical protein
MPDPLDNWRWRNPLPQGNALDGIAFGAGRFVAVSRAGSIATLPDGVLWTPTYVGGNLAAVRFFNDIFLARGTILISPDGITWTPQSAGTRCAMSHMAMVDMWRSVRLAHNPAGLGKAKPTEINTRT